MLVKTKKSEIPKFWWKNQFDKNYYTVYLPQLPIERTLFEVEFLKKSISLNRNQKILDLGCGHGRHTLELAQQKFNITGLDFSKYFLNIARKEAKKQNISTKFIERDMRLLKMQHSFDSIISMFSSFGYFPHDENINVLKNIFAALKPGGKFLIDVINSHDLAKNALKDGEKLANELYETKLRYDLDSVSITETNTYSKESQIGHTHKIWSKKINQEYCIFS